MGGWIDFRSIKQAVSISDILDHYGIVLKPSGPGALRGACPLPTHSSTSCESSFMVNLDKNVWVCHSQSCIGARCGALGGNILDFVCWMEGCSLRMAGLFLQSLCPPGNGNRLIMNHRKANAATLNRELSFQLRPLQSDHAYLKQRGIDSVLADQFGIGFYAGAGIMSGRVVIRIHNQHGSLVGYAGRSINGAKPRYRFPRGFQKSSELYNLHRCIGTSVVLVEGFFDALSVVRAGFDAVALMGVALSEQQKMLLLRRFSEVVLLLDGDDAGRRATERIRDALKYDVRPGLALCQTDASQTACRQTRSLSW
jgi:DNA primase